jgi:hypothetical protein
MQGAQVQAHEMTAKSPRDFPEYAIVAGWQNLSEPAVVILQLALSIKLVLESQAQEAFPNDHNDQCGHA